MQSDLSSCALMLLPRCGLCSVCSSPLNVMMLSKVREDGLERWELSRLAAELQVRTSRKPEPSWAQKTKPPRPCWIPGALSPAKFAGLTGNMLSTEYHDCSTETSDLRNRENNIALRAHDSVSAFLSFVFLFIKSSPVNSLRGYL